MRNWRPKKRRKLKRKPFRTTWCGKTDFCLGQLILVINQYWGQPREGSRCERRSVLCWQLSHLGWTSFPPVSRLDYFYWITKPQGRRLKWPDQIAHQSYFSAWRPLRSLRTSWRERGIFRTSRNGWRKDQSRLIRNFLFFTNNFLIFANKTSKIIIGIVM